MNTLLCCLIVLIPMGLIFYLAFHSRRYIRGVADYLAAGRVAGRYILTMGSFESCLGLITIVAMVEQKYQCGFALEFWNNIMLPITIIMTMTGFITYRYRETRALSVGQFFEMRYSHSFRIVAAGLRSFAEMMANAIGPAVAARFFIYFLGLPHVVNLFGWKIELFVVLLAVSLLICILIIWPGGRLSLLITDAFQSLVSFPIFVIFTVWVLTEFSWNGEIIPVMANRVSGESFLNPYDIQNLRDFNLFALVALVFTNIFTRGSYIGNENSCCGRTPHEQKMGGVIGTFRAGFANIMCMLITLAIITVMNHRDFAPQAKDIRLALTSQVAEAVVENPEVREKIQNRLNEIPAEQFYQQQDTRLSRVNNPDALYLNAALDTLKNEPGGYETFQAFRTYYNQLLMPVAFRKMLPPVLMGVFILLLLTLMISTDDTRIFNAATTIVQDVVIPLKKRVLTPQEHLKYLKFGSAGVALFFFIGSLFMGQMDYINMFITIMSGIWVGGCGAVMLCGLYSRWGTTAGAFASIITGAVMSVSGILLQYNWAGKVYPFLEKMGWVDNVGSFLSTVSRPLNPYIIWEMTPVKFPVNSYEISVLTIICSYIAYTAVSLLTYKKPFNLDWMLHRGKYALAEEHKVAEKWNWRKNLFRLLIGITPDYTRTDRILAWLAFGMNVIYQFGIAFILVIVWNMFSKWAPEAWSRYFFYTSLIIPGIVGVITTVWFSIGGIIDFRNLLRDLKQRSANPEDDGRVTGKDRS